MVNRAGNNKRTKNILRIALVQFVLYCNKANKNKLLSALPGHMVYHIFTLLKRYINPCGEQKVKPVHFGVFYIINLVKWLDEVGRKEDLPLVNSIG